MTNFLTHKGGKVVSAQLPLAVDDVTQASDRIAAPVETVTFNSAAAAGSSGINALDKSPILNLVGDKVGSYWGEDRNRLYKVQDTGLIGTLTETATSASVIITDNTNALDKLYETASGSRRYILKAIDNTGAVLYGWIGDITVSGAAYTIPIHNAVTGGAQSWVGTLANFDNAAVRTVEIYSYESSFVWVTGTVLTEEVAFDSEVRSDGAKLREFYASLTDGQYGVDYQKGAIAFKKATTGTSDTCNYNTRGSISVTVSGSGGSSTLVDDAAFTVATSEVTPIGFLADDTATDSVDEGDVGIARMSLDRKILTSGDYVDDTAFTPAGSNSYVHLLGAQADDTATDSVDEGDVGAVRMSLDRKLLVGGAYVDDAAFTPAGANSYVVGVGMLADETATDSVDEGDIGLARMTLDRRSISANQILDDAAFGVGTEYVGAVGFLADETTPDSVDEGDIGAPRMTLNRRIVTAGNVLDDAAFGIGTDYVTPVGYLVDDTTSDSADEGDVALPRMSATRIAYTQGRTAHDSAISATENQPLVIGARAADPTSLPTAVTAGDVSYIGTSLQQEVLCYLSRLISGEDQTNTVMQVVEKPLAVSTYTPDLDTSAALEASSVTKASAGVLYGFSASNTNATTHYIQFFNSTTVPADATVPVLEFAVAGESTVAYEWPKGRAFSTGIAWCISSTNGTKTIAGATALNDVNYK